MAMKCSKSFGWLIHSHDGPYIRCCGRYIPLEDDPGVFKHEKLNAYLYYLEEGKRWVVSNVAGATRCWMFTQAKDGQNNTESMDKWVYLDPSGRKWKADRKMLCEYWTRNKFSKSLEPNESKKRRVTSGSLSAHSGSQQSESSSKSGTFKTQQQTFKELEQAVKRLIEENYHLLQMKFKREESKNERYEEMKELRRQILEENMDLKLEIGALDFKAKKLEEETDDFEALSTHVNAKRESIAVLEVQRQELENAKRKMDADMLAMNSKLISQGEEDEGLS
mmetsp:Transcript_4477/g.6697  ORF Transcript_4477/g.6697 Transcript_4477/m.6697 type:complete len:279 (+) Transcript_4477:1649-2485(+)